MDTTGFSLPEDGWFHVVAFGEWPHKPTGLTQIIDDVCADEIIKSFTEFRAAPNWPGVLIDFDHQSLDQDKPTVAAGWITDLSKRDNGLWAQVRWSDIGRKSIEGGRYRFISPVWKSSDCTRLDGNRIRPLKLMNCAVTNDPNIHGLFPLSNSASGSQQISAPPMEIVPPPKPAKPAPPRKAVALPSAFGTAILSNRTDWSPAETRRRYRFAVASGADVVLPNFQSEKQKRWYYSAGPGASNAAPSASSAPQRRYTPRKEKEAQEALRKKTAREEIEQMRFQIQEAQRLARREADAANLMLYQIRDPDSGQILRSGRSRGRLAQSGFKKGRPADRGFSKGHGSNVMGNRSPISEDQRRAMFARMGSSGGGGGGGTGGGGGSSVPLSSPADFGYGVPENNYRFSADSTPNPYAEQAEGYKAERFFLKQMMRPKPRSPVGYDQINVQEEVRRLMATPGTDAGDVIALRNKLTAENARRREEWRKVEQRFKKAYKDKKAGERALQKYIGRVEQEHQKELLSWRKDTDRTLKQIAKLDTKIAVAEERAKVYDLKAEQTAREQDRKNAAQELRQWVAEQKEARAQQTAALKEAKAAEQRPVQQAKLEAAKPALFWKLLSQGGRETAMNLYPDVDYSAAVEEWKSMQRNVGRYDAKTKQDMLRSFNNTPPPMVK